MVRCQVKQIKNMDCTNYIVKIREQLFFVLKNPLRYQNMFLNRIRHSELLTDIRSKNQSSISTKRTKGDSPLLLLSDLKEGDLICIRSKDEILKTLDKANRLEGCLFMDEMWQYCGTEHRILKKVQNFYDEANYRMCKASNIVLLDGVFCSGRFDRYSVCCDRYCLLFWKEAWLKKIK